MSLLVGTGGLSHSRPLMTCSLAWNAFAKECKNEYDILGYTPPAPATGVGHTSKVKVEPRQDHPSVLVPDTAT
jgi:hypothetical protein